MKWLVRSIVTIVLIGIIVLSTQGVLKKLESMKKAPERVQKTEEIKIYSGYRVQLENITMEVEGYGTVQPSITYTIVPEVSGRVVTLFEEFKEGNIMMANQEIMKIDPAKYKIALASQKASIERMQIELKQLEIEKSNILKTRKLLVKEQEIQENELNRNSQLLKTKAISRAAFDSSSLQYQKGLNALQNIDNSLALFPVRKETLKKRMEIEDIRLEDLKLNLENTVISSPFLGIVEKKNVEVGEWVSAGKTLGSIYNINEVEIPVPLEMRDFMWIMRNSGKMDFTQFNNQTNISERFGKVVIEMSGNQNSTFTWNGHVSRIDPNVDPATRTIRVVVAVDNPFAFLIEGIGPPLKPGVFCKVKFHGIQLKNCFRVPALSLRDGNTVYTGTNGILKTKKVEVARSQGQFTYITKGLEDNDLVIGSILTAPVEGISVEVNIEDKL